MIYPKEYYINGKLWDVDYAMNVGSAENKRQLLQLLYNQYVAIRLVLGGNKCNKASLLMVKEWLEDPQKRQKVRETLNMSDKDIDMIVFISENEIPFVR